jgi:hypothetical protein
MRCRRIRDGAWTAYAIAVLVVLAIADRAMGGTGAVGPTSVGGTGARRA